LTICRFSLIYEYHFPVSDVQKAISRTEGESNGAKSPVQPNPGAGSISGEVLPDLRRQQLEVEVPRPLQAQDPDPKKTTVVDSCKVEGTQKQLVGGVCAKPVAGTRLDDSAFRVPENQATNRVPEQVQSTAKARSNENSAFKVPENHTTNQVPEQIQSTVKASSNENAIFKVPEKPATSKVPLQIQNIVKTRSNENSVAKKQVSTYQDDDEDQIECLDLTGLDSEMSESEAETEPRSSSDTEEDDDVDQMEEDDDDEESTNVVNMSPEEHVSLTTLFDFFASQRFHNIKILNLIYIG
jgi:hypothetical protein